MKYKNITWGQTEAVFNKLGGEEGVKRFLSGETVVSAPILPNKTNNCVFKNDKTKDAWQLIADIKPSGIFTPDFLSVLEPKENLIDTDTVFARTWTFKSGQCDLEWLEANQYLIPKNKQKCRIYALRTIWQDNMGRLRIPCLRWIDGVWFMDFALFFQAWNNADLILNVRK